MHTVHDGCSLYLTSHGNLCNTAQASPGIETFPRLHLYLGTCKAQTTKTVNHSDWNRRNPWFRSVKLRSQLPRGTVPRGASPECTQ